MDDVKVIDKELFDKLLRNHKDKAIGMLKDEDGNWLEYVKIGKDEDGVDLVYRIFSDIKEKRYYENITYEEVLMSEVPSDHINDLLPNKSRGLLVCPIIYKENIESWKFKGWYFLDQVNFAYSSFNNGVNFSGATFADDVIFYNTTFVGNAFFENTLFIGNTNFILAIFYKWALLNDTIFNQDATFTNTHFYDRTTFRKAVFQKGALFCDSIANNTINFNVKAFNGPVDFRDCDYRELVKIDIRVLCANEKRLSNPVKLFIIDKDKDDKSLMSFWKYNKYAKCFKNKYSEKDDLFESTKYNLHAVKKICNANSLYNEEDHIYYWYRVFERKCDHSIFTNIFRPLEIFFIDMLTKYFTSPGRVFTVIFILFIACLISYWGIGLNSIDHTLVYNNIKLSQMSPELSDEMKSILTEKGYDIKSVCSKRKVPLKQAIGNIFYFNIITYTTIGYGDIQPLGLLKIIAGLEGLFGIFLNSIFLITLTKKVLW